MRLASVTAPSSAGLLICAHRGPQAPLEPSDCLHVADAFYKSEVTGVTLAKGVL